MGTKRININKVVKVEDNEITVLESAFEYEDGFKGLVGITFEIVSKESFYETIEPYLNNDKEVLIYFAENFWNLTREMIEGVDSSEEGLIELFFDTSCEELWTI